VRKNTARGGRRGRGRIYLPWFIAEDGVDEVGLITPGTIGAIQAAMDVWRTKLVDFDLPMYVLHNSGISATGTPDQVTSLRVQGMIATQRRRLGR
jgi:hypothetical protein